MSATASIDISLGRSFDTVRLIDSFINNGWNCNDNGLIVYLPLGDNDDFDWQTAPLNEYDEVLAVIESKIKASELVGISLTNDQLNSGGLFHFNEADGSIMMLVQNNRLRIAESNITDYSLYLNEINKVLPGLAEAIICTDTY